MEIASKIVRCANLFIFPVRTIKLLDNQISLSLAFRKACSPYNKSLIHDPRSCHHRPKRQVVLSKILLSCESIGVTIIFTHPDHVTMLVEYHRTWVCKDDASRRNEGILTGLALWTPCFDVEVGCDKFGGLKLQFGIHSKASGFIF